MHRLNNTKITKKYKQKKSPEKYQSFQRKKEKKQLYLSQDKKTNIS